MRYNAVLEYTDNFLIIYMHWFKERCDITWARIDTDNILIIYNHWFQASRQDMVMIASVMKFQTNLGTWQLVDCNPYLQNKHQLNTLTIILSPLKWRSVWNRIIQHQLSVIIYWIHTSDTDQYYTTPSENPWDNPKTQKRNNKTQQQWWADKLSPTMTL